LQQESPLSSASGIHSPLLKRGEPLGRNKKEYGENIEIGNNKLLPLVKGGGFAPAKTEG
jgi:hypothetical protein